MRTSEYQHFIFVRPPGSFTWTLHFLSGVPFRTGDAKAANREAQNLAEHSQYSAIVIPVKLPRDAEQIQYALFADGDTVYLPTSPTLISKSTNQPK